MNKEEVIGQLEALGNPKMKAHHIKFGSQENVYGVKMGDIRALAKKIKTDHELALALWETGNVDSRLLAILIMKPKELSKDQVNEMIKSMQYSQVADWFQSYVIKELDFKDSLRIEGMKSSHPMEARAAWALTAGKVARDPDQVNIPELLDTLESEMGSADPLIQWTMNTCLAYIGIHHAEYRDRALAIGEKLGVLRDYPTSKGCTSPFAPIWINEMVKRKEG